MSEEIIKVLDDLGNRFGIAIDWSNENILPYLQELTQKFITYKIATTTFWLVLDIIIFIIAIIALIKGIKIFTKSYDNCFDDSTMCISLIIVTISVIFLTITSLSIPGNATELIKECTIPEMVVYEYVKGVGEQNV